MAMITIRFVGVIPEGRENFMGFAILLFPRSYFSILIEGQDFLLSKVPHLFSIFPHPEKDAYRPDRGQSSERGERGARPGLRGHVSQARCRSPAMDEDCTTTGIHT